MGIRVFMGAFGKSPPYPENLVSLFCTDETRYCPAPRFGAGQYFFSHQQTERYRRGQIGAVETLSAPRLGGANRSEPLLYGAVSPSVIPSPRGQERDKKDKACFSLVLFFVDQKVNRARCNFPRGMLVSSDRPRRHRHGKCPSFLHPQHGGNQRQSACPATDAVPKTRSNRREHGD